jgi:hypothetical protein
MINEAVRTLILSCVGRVWGRRKDCGRSALVFLCAPSLKSLNLIPPSSSLASSKMSITPFPHSTLILRVLYRDCRTAPRVSCRNGTDRTPDRQCELPRVLAGTWAVHWLYSTRARAPTYRWPLHIPSASIMSVVAVASTSTPHSNFVSIFNAALETYRRKTKKDLTTHPLLLSLQSCDSPEAILTVLRDQIPAFSQSQNGDDGLTKWVAPTVTVLYAFSATLGGGVGLVSIMYPYEIFLL